MILGMNIYTYKYYMNTIENLSNNRMNFLFDK